MTRGFTKSLLFLDGAPDLPTLEAVSGMKTHRASGPLEAAKWVAELRPEVVVIKAEVSWHRTFIAHLPPEQRPAILAVGGGNRAPDASLVDEWIFAGRDAAESGLRLNVARQRAQLRRRTARRAFVDSLTQLPNRRASIRALLRENARARRVGGQLSLVLIDLDHFKQVNERGGHPAGDRLLRKVGGALRKTARGTELCGRIGGDEFALVVPAGEGVALRAAQRVREALRSIGVSASVAACELKSGERLQALYKRTDQALKTAKTERRSSPPEGRGRVTGEAFAG